MLVGDRCPLIRRFIPRSSSTTTTVVLCGRNDNGTPYLSEGVVTCRFRPDVLLVARTSRGRERLQLDGAGA